MSIPSPASVVQAQLDAYNAKDIEALLRTYAPDAEQFAFHGERLARGHEEMRTRFLQRFAEPDLHARLLSRTVQGSIVIDAELITRNFPEGLGTLELLCIYEVAEGRIRRATFATGTKAMVSAPPALPAVATFPSETDIADLLHQFDARTLPKPRWTHHAHLVVAHEYLRGHTPAEALDLLRDRIKAYNLATGTANTDAGGYHETLTRLFLQGVQAHLNRAAALPVAASVEALLRSPLGDKHWPLNFYSSEVLFSTEARHGWREPDRAPQLWREKVFVF